jgi:hypothetical protein
MSKKKKKMKKMGKTELFKKTWIYPAFGILAIIFCAFFFERMHVLNAQKTTTATVKNEQIVQTEASPKAANTVIAATVPSENSKSAPIQNSIAASPVVVTSSVVPIQEKTTARVKIAGLGNFAVELKDGDNAFDLLKRAAAENGFSVDYSFDPKWGAFINAINGKANKDPYYWSLYYKGKASEVGASLLKVNRNDVTEWRFESWM